MFCFRFDFSLVYFNPRLSTEHGRIIDLLDNNDEFFDACAGVGPFAVPAAKKLSSKVHANDLNPESFKWLCENAKINKVDSKMSCHNMDARQFIKEVVKPHLLTKGDNLGKVHIAMNLPAIATQFLDAFRGLLVDENADGIRQPFVHVYAFADETEEPEQEVKDRCCQSMGASSDADIQVHYVRNISPKAGMYRATFQVPIEVLTASDSRDVQPDAKKAKVES